MKRRGDAPVAITTARTSHSEDLHARQIRYLLSMGVRTVCFVAAVIAHGPLRWVLIAAALFLPYIAVVMANAGGRRSRAEARPYTPEPFGQLGPGPNPPAAPQQ